MLGNTEKHTIHNNIPSIQTSFSSIINEHVDDFQSAHMIQKIKKIKKKKQKQNITGMADFDVLTNTNNEGSPLAAADATATHAHVPTSTNTSASSIFNMQYWKQLIFGKTVEGVVNFKEDDYEGRDNLKEPIRKTNIRGKIKNMIESAYAKVNKVNQRIAAGICNGISSNTATKNDIAIVRNQIVLLETALISMPVAYNWYYLMFYAKDAGVNIPELSRTALYKKFGSFKPIQLLLYLFNIALWFPEKLDGFLIQQIPGMTSRFLNGTCKFILIYVLCFIMIKYSAVTVKDFFIDLVTDATGNWVINLMFAIVFVLFLISVFTLNFIGDIGHDVQEVMSVGETMMNPIWSLIRMIIRFLITIVISVPLSAILCGLYLFLYSFFGAYIYGGLSKGISRCKADIDAQIRRDNAGIFEEDTCNNGGLWAFILSIIGAIFTVMKYAGGQLLKIVIAAIFIYSSITITSKFSNKILNRSVFISINIIITLIAVAFAISGIVNEYIKSARADSDVNPSTLEKPIVNSSPNNIQSVNNPLLKPVVSATPTNIPIPQVASSLPEVASSLPEVASSLPEVASSLPEVASSLPEVASSLPQIPQVQSVLSQIPQVQSVLSQMPQAASSLPQVQSVLSQIPQAESVLQQGLNGILPNLLSKTTTNP
jgi:hypothetical protein